ncbi:MAG: 16S rRNA (cytosine(967)-C(5))-methyltransferase RsmB [Thermoanaerobaculia bacterium]
MTGSPSVSPARARAIEVLWDVLRHGARAAPLLVARGHDLSPEDQGLMRELVLGVLRNKARLDAEIASVSRLPLERLSPRVLQILEVGLYQIRNLDRVPAYAAVDQAVWQARRAAGEGAARLVNALLRSLQRRTQPPGALPSSPEGLARETSHPEFLVRRWLELFGQTATREILEADNAASGLDLMANPSKTTREELAAAFEAEGVHTVPSSVAPNALTVESGNPIRSPLFAAGHFSVQDVGSQALSLLLPEGERLVDLAAAPGGKTFAALFAGRARRVVSLDRSASRLRMLVENARRLGVEGAWPAAGDFLAPPLPAASFDRVLLDAPCSGTGTLRKNPEIRYRVTPEAIERLSQMQEQGVEAAARLLAPGGYLLYSTCSLEHEENERVIERVLGRNLGLDRAKIDAPEGLRAFVRDDVFRMFPGPDRDGFTAHLLRRRS